jgi:hypothetical protein
MTNVTHKFLSMYLFLIITLYMFRAPHFHHQERQIVSTQLLVTVTLCWWPSANETATNTEGQLPEVVLIQFVSPDDDHEVLETSREL